MAAGKAVIASPVDGVKSLLEDGINGLAAPPGNPENLAEKITFLLENPDIRKKLGETAKQTVEDKYSPETMINAFDREFKSL